MALNRITLMGRLTRDPELRHTSNNTAVATVSLACDRDVKNKATGEHDTDFFDVVCWNATAEFAARYLTKGRLIAVDGRLQNRSWTDRDGNRRVTYEIIAQNVYPCDSRPTSSADPCAPVQVPDAAEEEFLPF